MPVRFCFVNAKIPNEILSTINATDKTSQSRMKSLDSFLTPTIKRELRTILMIQIAKTEINERKVKISLVLSLGFF